MHRRFFFLALVCCLACSAFAHAEKLNSSQVKDFQTRADGGDQNAKCALAEYYIVEKKDFNSYGARRGNDRVMVRGTFANIRLKNLMVPGVEGGVTVFRPGSDSEPIRMPIYDAAMKYKETGTPLVILAGKEYGSGSSRDWAAKGTLLLGVRAVIAESFERIHRSNLVGMGVLPIVFKDGQNAESLGLKGDESLSISGLDEKSLTPRQTLIVTVKRADGSAFSFEATCRLDTAVEINYYKNGGILQTVLRKMLS